MEGYARCNFVVQPLRVDAMKYFLLPLCLIAFLVVVSCVQPPTVARQPVVPQPKADTKAPSVAPQPQAKVALKLPLKNPRIVVFKRERRLELYSGESMVRTYHVGLGLNPVPDKIRQGDRATPEGNFYVFTKNDKSAFYLSLGISYPNVEDAERDHCRHC